MKLTKIHSISKLKKQTYDITVEKNHNFFCNNHLIHNCSYTDEIGVLLINFAVIGEPLAGQDAERSIFGSKNAYHISPGDRIAQIIFEKIESANFIEVDNLKSTDRTGGYGSTGR
jgi:dUTPase